MAAKQAETFEKVALHPDRHAVRVKLMENLRAPRLRRLHGVAAELRDRPVQTAKNGSAA